jgi:hypothetical protein
MEVAECILLDKSKLNKECVCIPIKYKKYLYYILLVYHFEKDIYKALKYVFGEGDIKKVFEKFELKEGKKCIAIYKIPKGIKIIKKIKVKPTFCYEIEKNLAKIIR